MCANERPLQAQVCNAYACKVGGVKGFCCGGIEHAASSSDEGQQTLEMILADSVVSCTAGEESATASP